MERAQAFARIWKPAGLSCETHRIDAPGGAERRARPAQRRAGKRQAFRKGKFPAKGPPGSRTMNLDLSSIPGFDPGFCTPPTSRVFQSLAWLRAHSTRSLEQERKVQGLSGPSSCRAKVRPAGTAGGGLQRSGPAVDVQPPAAGPRPRPPGQASVASQSLVFVPQIRGLVVSCICSKAPRVQSPVSSFTQMLV